MPEFEEAYRQARRDNFSQLTAGFQQACPLALGTLLTIMTDGKARPAIKVRAAIFTVQYATQAVAQENLQARVQRLEQTQQEPASSVCAGPLPVETARRSPGKGHGSKFDRKKEEAIAALLTQPTMEGAARTAKISTKTLQRWLQTAEFQQAYVQARWDRFGQLTAQFQQACFGALAILRNVMLDSAASAASKLRAAQFTLQFSAQALQEDLPVRVQRLEQQLDGPTWANQEDDRKAA